MGHCDVFAMTRDEHREECFKAIRGVMRWDDSPGARRASQIILDAIHGIARVVPIEQTEEMIDEGADLLSGLVSEGRESKVAVQIYAAMSAAGDLTNPPFGRDHISEGEWPEWRAPRINPPEKKP
jgi:exosome complex RNA-binding protein Csl4